MTCEFKNIHSLHNVSTNKKKMLGDTMVSDTIFKNIKFLRVNLKNVKVK